MVKVTLVHSVYLSLKNGANTVMRTLLSNIDNFANNGIEIKALTPDTFRVRSFEKSKITMKDRIRNRITDTLIFLSRYSVLAAVAIFYIREQRPGKIIANRYIFSANHENDDVVFFHTLFPCYYFLKFRKNQRQKIVMVLHTNGETFKMSKIYYPKLGTSKYFRKILRIEEYTLQHVDRINFVSKSSKDNFLLLHPQINPDKVFYIYNGVEITPIVDRRSLHFPLEIVCVASISDRKGQLFIIDALKKIDDRIKEKVHFTFVGDGISRAQLEKDVKDSGLNGYVTFIGVTNNVDEYLKNSDIYILPSEDEGLPMAIIEAMRASLPIISTSVGGIPEMIENGINGLLIAPNADSIENVLEHIEDCDWLSMGQCARRTFEDKFTLEKMLRGYSTILKF